MQKNTLDSRLERLPPGEAVEAGVACQDGEHTTPQGSPGVEDTKGGLQTSTTRSVCLPSLPISLEQPREDLGSVEAGSEGCRSTVFIHSRVASATPPRAQQRRSRASTRSAGGPGAVLSDIRQSHNRKQARRQKRAFSSGDDPLVLDLPGVSLDVRGSTANDSNVHTRIQVLGGATASAVPHVVRECSNEGSSASSGEGTPRVESLSASEHTGRNGHQSARASGSGSCTHAVGDDRNALSKRGELESEHGDGEQAAAPRTTRGREDEKETKQGTTGGLSPRDSSFQRSLPDIRPLHLQWGASASAGVPGGRNEASGQAQGASQHPPSKKRERLWSESCAPVYGAGEGTGREYGDAVWGGRTRCSTDVIVRGRHPSDGSGLYQHGSGDGVFGTGSIGAEPGGSGEIPLGGLEDFSLGLDLEANDSRGSAVNSPERGLRVGSSGCSVRSGAFRTARAKSLGGRPRGTSGCDGSGSFDDSEPVSGGVPSEERDDVSSSGDDVEDDDEKHDPRADQRDLLRPKRLLRRAQAQAESASLQLWQQQWRRAVGIVLAALFVLIIAAYSGAKLAADYKRRLIASHEGRALRVCSHRGRGLVRWPEGMGLAEPVSPGFIPLLLGSNQGPDSAPQGARRDQYSKDEEVEFWAPSLLTHMYAMLRGRQASRPPGQEDQLTGASAGVSCFDIDVTPVRKEWVAKLARLHAEVFASPTDDESQDGYDDDAFEGEGGGDEGEEETGSRVDGDTDGAGGTRRRGRRASWLTGGQGPSSFDHVRGLSSSQLWAAIAAHEHVGRALTGEGKTEDAAVTCADSFVPGEKWAEVRRFSCLAEHWLGAWQPTEADEEADAEGAVEDPLDIVSGRTYGETAAVVLLAVHPSELVRIGAATAQAAAAAHHSDHAIMRLQARASVGPSAAPPTLAEFLKFLTTPRLDTGAPLEPTARRLAVTGQLPEPPPFDSGLTTKSPQMLVTMELKSTSEAYADLLYDAIQARSAGMLNARSRAGVFVVETSFDALRRRRRTSDAVGLAVALLDLPLPATTASSTVCAAATAMHEREEEHSTGESAGRRQLRTGDKSLYGWISDSSSAGSGGSGVAGEFAADMARQELIDKVVDPLTDHTVQVVMPSVYMLRTCGGPIRKAAPMAREVGIPLPVTAWTVDDVPTACDLWVNEGATGVISNRAGMIAEAMAGRACEQLLQDDPAVAGRRG